MCARRKDSAFTKCVRVCMWPVHERRVSDVVSADDRLDENFEKAAPQRHCMPNLRRESVRLGFSTWTATFLILGNSPTFTLPCLLFQHEDAHDLHLILFSVAPRTNQELVTQSGDKRTCKGEDAVPIVSLNAAPNKVSWPEPCTTASQRHELRVFHRNAHGDLPWHWGHH